MATATPTPSPAPVRAPLPSELASFPLPKAALDAIARIEAAFAMSRADRAAHAAASYVRPSGLGRAA
jgi:hypothetical protein